MPSDPAVRLPRVVVRIANAITTFALLAGIPRPPYNRDNALIVETVGRASGKRRRIPVGYTGWAREVAGVALRGGHGEDLAVRLE